MNILFFSSCRKDTGNQLESMIRSIYFQADEEFIFQEYKGPVWILGVKIYPKVNVLHFTFAPN